MDYFSILSTIFKFLFIIIVYLFIINTLRDILTYFYKESKNRNILIRVREGNNFIDIPIVSHFTIGRAKDNDYVLFEQSISKHHLQIIDDGFNFFVLDLNSSNGTYLNEKLIKKSIIKPGDVIAIGGSNVKIEVLK